MQASVAPATSHQGQLAIEPFAGTVTVRFSDAIVAATERAKVLREEGREPVFYIPFEDIYFDLFEKTNTTSQAPLKGTASYWRVHAVGSSAHDLTPDTAARAIARHGAFDPEKARIDEPAEQRHTSRSPGHCYSPQ